MNIYRPRRSASILLLLCLGLTLMIAAQPTAANHATYLITGIVRDNLGLPIAGASVTLLNSGLAPTISAADGSYRFEAVPEGSYDVEARADGCRLPQTQQLTVDADEDLSFSLAQKQGSFGYRCVVEAAAWIDGETVLPQSGDDWGEWVELPFAFLFYDRSHTTAYIASNGFLTFLNSNVSPNNGQLPSTVVPNGAIYPFWDDLVVDGSASVRTATLGSAPNRRFVVEWRNVHVQGDPTRRVRFEAILEEAGDIVFQYADIAPDEREQGSSATIGIEHLFGNAGFEFSRNQPSIAENMAIRISFAGGSQEGVITSSGGAALSGATLHFTGPVEQTVSTNAEGFYRARLPGGSYTLNIRAFGHVAQTATITISPDQTAQQSYMLSALPTHTVAGFTYDAYDRPLAGVEVRLLNSPLEPVISDASGAYRLAQVPEGSHTLQATQQRCADPHAQDVTVDADEQIVFNLNRWRDAFGHYCRVAQATWIDATATLPLTGDNATTLVDLPFAFNFYGESYPRFVVSTNGFISFTTWDLSPVAWNEPLTEEYGPNMAIYPFWDDLVVDGSASVRTATLGSAPNRRFVVEWRNVHAKDDPDARITFEIVLHETGEILFQYADIGGNRREQGGSATIGIKGASGSDALQYSFDTASVSTGMAIKLYPARGTLRGIISGSDGTPIAGATVQVNGPATYALTTDEQGVYTGQVQVGSYSATASAFGYQPQTSQPHVFEDELAALNFDLPFIPRHRVAGVVRDNYERPLAHATVQIVGTPLAPITTGQDGVYSFAAVPEGEYVVRVETSNRCLTTQTLDQQLIVDGDEERFLSLPRLEEAFGYGCRVEPSSWIATTSDLSFSGDNRATWISLPFTFNFYGYDVTSINVSTNGLLNFMRSETTPWNTSLPSAQYPNAAIYAFWDDLVVDASASVRTATLGSAPNRRFVVEWRNVYLASDPSRRLSIEAILEERGDIVLQYADIDSYGSEQGSGATIGLESPDGTTGLQYAYNQAVASNDQAIRFFTSQGTLAGRLTDPDGLPIAQGTIQLNGTTAYTVTTAADGSYSILVPTGSYSVHASAFGHLAQSAAGVVVKEAQTNKRDFALTRIQTHPVSGILRDSVGLPVANASVTLVGTPIPPAISDANGSYGFAAVPQGAYDLQATLGNCTLVETRHLVVDSAEQLDISLTRRQDSFGYQCRVESAAYIEADTVVSVGGDGWEKVSLPFAFPFYGRSYSSVYISSKGYLSFEAGSSDAANSALPSSAAPNAAVYAFWDEIYQGDASIKIATLGSAPNRRFVVEWENNWFGGTTPQSNFEIVLHENGQILLQYDGISSDELARGSTATIGIENHGGSVALLYSYNSAVLRDDLAIRYYLPRGYIEGQVISAEYFKALPGAIIRVLQGNTEVARAIADINGSYRIQVPLGSYSVEASAPGYETSRASASVREPDMPIRLDFKLHLMPVQGP